MSGKDLARGLGLHPPLASTWTTGVTRRFIPHGKAWRPRKRGGLRGAAYAGFTLMEVLVAMIIMALSVTVFLQLLSASLNLERRSREAVREMMEADRLLEDLQRNDVRDADFAWSGEQGNLVWKLQMTPLEMATLEMEDEEPLLILPLELFKYELRYAWGGKSERVLTRYAAYPKDFFDDEFRARVFARIE